MTFKVTYFLGPPKHWKKFNFQSVSTTARPLDGRLAGTMHLILGDGVPPQCQGGLQSIHTACSLGTRPPLQNGLDAVVHHVQCWERQHATDISVDDYPNRDSGCSKFWPSRTSHCHN